MSKDYNLEHSYFPETKEDDIILMNKTLPF